MTYKLPIQLRDAIFATLQTRPYNEVAEGYFALESLHRYEEGLVAIQGQMRDSLLAYLGSLPFEQVRSLVPALTNLVEVEENRSAQSVSEE